MEEFGLEFFIWPRPVDGFVWEDGKATGVLGNDVDQTDAEETRFLRWRTSSRKVFRTNLLQTQPTLYRTFASLEPTEEAFLAFANEYGSLGVDVVLEAAFKPTTSEEGKPIKQFFFADPRNNGEPLWRWREAHSEITSIANVLTAIERNDIAVLGQLFTTTKDNRIFYGDGTRWQVVCSPHEGDSRSWLWKWAMEGETEAEQLLRVARGWSQGRINAAMSNVDERRRQSLTSARVLLSPERGSFRLHVVPDTLLAAMWLQCARVLTENVTNRTCEHCKKWFEVSPDSRRTNSKYCSDRCKVAAYRIRKSAAAKYVEA
jgi:hypothetical protein